ncbi:MAG: stage II sporulation protein M [Acetivibrio sp.]
MKKNGYLKKLCILFFIGLILGIVAATLLKENYIEDYQQYFKQAAEELTNGKIQYGLLYYKILQRVLLPFGLIAAFSFSTIAMPVSIAFVAYEGYTMGYFFQSLSLTFQLKGILYGVLYGMPQILVYGPAMVILLYYVYQKEEKRREKKGFTEKVLPAGIFLMVLCAGAFLETFVNSWIMKNTIFLVH